MASTSNDTDTILEDTSLSVVCMLLKPVACVHPLESAHPQLIPPGHQIPDWMFGQYSSWGIQTVVLGGMGIFVGDPLRTQTIGERLWNPNDNGGSKGRLGWRFCDLTNDSATDDRGRLLLLLDFGSGGTSFAVGVDTSVVVDTASDNALALYNFDDDDDGSHQYFRLCRHVKEEDGGCARNEKKNE